MALHVRIDREAHHTLRKRDQFIAVLLEGIEDMPGCLSYVVAKDSADDNVIRISEIWARKEDHEASLSLPAVQRSIARGRAMIAEIGESVVTEPVGGSGAGLRLDPRAGQRGKT